MHFKPVSYFAQSSKRNRKCCNRSVSFTKWRDVKIQPQNSPESMWKMKQKQMNRITFNINHVLHFFFFLYFSAIMGLVSCSSAVDEIISSYSCCNPIVTFDPSCENTWRMDDKVQIHMWHFFNISLTEISAKKMTVSHNQVDVQM